MAATSRFLTHDQSLTELISFLAEYWSNWNRKGRPQIASAYKAFLAETFILARCARGLNFDDLREHVDSSAGMRGSLFSAIWPDWAEVEKERARLTLKGAIDSTDASGMAVTDADIAAFVEFIAKEELEAFFWRLRSFEEHDLRGNEFAITGMQSDIQGMAVAVEHIAATLGGTGGQLYKRLKCLWKEPNVSRILRRSDTLMRQGRSPDAWPALKAEIDALCDEPGGQVAADLIIAHRIRGGVHDPLWEHDHFELEALFLRLMRAALWTFVEVRRRRTPMEVAELK